MNVLFICFSATNRSPTAADLFKDKWNTKAFALYPYSDYTKLNPKLEKFLVWADKVYVMKEWMYRKIEENFPKYINKVKNLDIDDIYDKDDPLLINILNEKFVNIIEA